jgi:hypothetical protein
MFEAMTRRTAACMMQLSHGADLSEVWQYG